MGHIQAFNINEILHQFQSSVYVETGTGVGDSLSHALKFPFKSLYSVELDPGLYQSAAKTFVDSRLNIINDYSKNALQEILKKVDINDNILFFLDAHFPEADFGIGSDRYKNSFLKYGKDALPLEEELLIIKKGRPLNKDVIIIDDVWIYETGPFETGNWSERQKMPIGNMDFARKIFEETHKVEISYKQQGYMVIKPNIE